MNLDPSLPGRRFRPTPHSGSTQQPWLRRLLPCLVLAALAIVGCDKPKTDGEASAASDKKVPATAEAAETWEKKSTMDCPTHVNTAKISLKDVDGGYEVTVISDDSTDATRIAEYSAYLAGASKFAKDPVDALKVRGGYTGNRNNNCPILMKDTVVTQKPVSGGAELTVKPKDPAELAELRKTAKDTLKTLLEFKAVMRDALKDK